MIQFLARYVTSAIYLGCVAVVMLIVSNQIGLVAGLVTIAGLILVATLLAEVHGVHVQIQRLEDQLNAERREP